MLRYSARNTYKGKRQHPSWLHEVVVRCSRSHLQTLERDISLHCLRPADRAARDLVLIHSLICDSYIVYEASVRWRRFEPSILISLS